MNKNLKTIKRERGATLSLVAVCAIVIIVFGLVTFFMIKLMGGGRELSNATEAGILNVAKIAVKQPDESCPAEFAACAVPPGSRISLLTYNRCVAQTLLVVLNANASRTQQANANAQRVVKELETLGSKLRDKLVDSNVMGTFFVDLANANYLKMLGGRPTSLTDYDTAYLRAGQSTNVYLDPSNFPGPVPQGIYSTGQLTAPGGFKYLAGYKPLASIGGLEVYGVPVFPQQRPHLISLSEFVTGRSAPAPHLPPNSFKAVGNSTDQLTSKQVGMVACAIVGSTDYPVSIPGGYIEIENMPGLSLDLWKDRVCQDSSIFNEELYAGLYVSNNGCFSTNDSEMQAWAAYNNSTGGDSHGHDAALYPPSIGFPIKVPDQTGGVRRGKGTGQAAILSELLGIKTLSDCQDYVYDHTTAGPCADYFQDIVGNFKRKTYFPNIPAAGYVFTNLEQFKTLIVNLNLDQTCWSGKLSTDFYTNNPSGLKVFDRSIAHAAPDIENPLNPPQPGNSGMYKSPVRFPYNFGETGTIRQLIKHASTCPDKIINELLLRVRQIKPGTSQSELDHLLDTPLPMGVDRKPNKQFIYLDSNGKLVMNNSQPPCYSGVAPDGAPAESCMEVVYRVDGTQINTTGDWYTYKNTATGAQSQVWREGDGLVNESPYLSIEYPTGTPLTDGIYAVDRAHWQGSSGAGNLLGRLQFANALHNPKPYYVFSHPN